MPHSKQGFGLAMIFWLFVVSLALPGCGATQATSAGTSGIEGITKVGPHCPVVSKTTPCPATPATKTVAVLSQDGHEVTRFISARDGAFRVPLPPGTYLLKDGDNSGGNAAPLMPDTVQVPQHTYVQIEVLFYTGIV